MSEATESGRWAHDMAFDVETSYDGLDPEKYPEGVRLGVAAAVAIRNRCSDWCRRHGYAMESLPVVGPHECRESTVCQCRMDADEPDERCPVHGAGMYPPKCAVCGRYMRPNRQEVDRAERSRD